jgi:acetyl-CoA carboxylase biotin carboxyl carrier protein
MDTKQIKSLMGDFDKSGLSKMKIKKDNFVIEMEKYTAPVVTAAPQQVVAAPVTQAAPVVTEAATEKKHADNALFITSPMVGTFYSAPSPTADPFVKVGDIVHAKQTVAIVEAMKIMNEIEAEFECKIVEILVKDGQLVEYEMPLFVVEKI